MQTKHRKFILISVLALGLIVWFAQETENVLSVTQMGVLDQLEQVDCGVVLTGAPGRIRESFEILAQRKIRKLVVSGVFKETQLHEIFPHLPFYPEVHPEDIILEKISGSTYGNAVQSLALVKTLGCRDILLITSRLHMHRSQKLFRQLFPLKINIISYPVQSLAREYSYLDVFIETVKSMFYSALGRVL